MEQYKNTDQYRSAAKAYDTFPTTCQEGVYSKGRNTDMAFDTAQMGSAEELSDEVRVEGLVVVGVLEILIQKCKTLWQQLSCLFDHVVSHACKETGEECKGSGANTVAPFT